MLAEPTMAENKKRARSPFLLRTGLPAAFTLRTPGAIPWCAPSTS